MEDLHLISNVLADDLVMKPMKKGYSRGLVDAGRLYENVVAASSDVTSSTGTDGFAQEFPERFVQVGIAEQTLVGVGAGLAAMGKMPFVAAYGAFSPGRNWEQIRTTICINDQPVKIIGTHVGLSDAPDGATHQILEDITLMRVLPNMTVVAPCDSIEAAKATLALANYPHPAYMRIARDNTSIITTTETPFELGRAYIYWYGTDVSIIATGRMTYRAMMAAALLTNDGIKAEVVHVPTIKPLDSETILASVKKTGAVVTCEEGQINGGLGSAITELLAENYPAPVKRIGLFDCFGQSGSPEDLFNFYKLDTHDIEQAAHDVLSRK